MGRCPAGCGWGSGNIICIHNVVAASAVVGLVGREGAVIRKTFWPFMYYAGVSGCLGYAIVWHSKEGWVNLGSVLLTLILIGMVWFAARELRKTNQQGEPCNSTGHKMVIERSRLGA